MKQNLTTQFIYPSYDIPTEHKEIIETIDHVKIIPAESNNLKSTDVVVFNSYKEITSDIIKDKIFVLRINKKNLFENCKNLSKHISGTTKFNIIITDIETFTDDDFTTYKEMMG